MTSRDRLEVVARDLEVRIRVLEGGANAIRHYVASGKLASRVAAIRLEKLTEAIQERQQELAAVLALLAQKQAPQQPNEEASAA